MARLLLVRPRLLRLLDSKWALPVLAELLSGSMGLTARQGGGARGATLQHRLGLAPATLSRTIETLLREGLVTRNPGYGHPLRPDYILTPDGMNVAEACLLLFRTLGASRLEPSSMRKWTIPALLALLEGRTRFTELREALPCVTPRALGQALRQLEDARLIVRRVTDSYPPRVEYGLLRRGERTADAAAHLACAAA